ncbi:MAG: DUF3857 and transglutaminase domain-containing protein [Acidobacteria bacterium]|nr:DUF3857 and transglutaminase domain-containing protein [Acidobacteriota bacterium]MDA1236017.1 DUF3857 and transglutaminase domain-containing protein [Acidobacteriota bacterium]
MRSFVNSVMLAAALGAWPAQIQAVDWDPVAPELLAVTAPRIDPNADSETISWQVWLEDRLLGGRQPQTMETQYLRVKIFTERGVEEQSTIDLVEAASDVQVSEIRGRTIKPDGTIVKLSKADVFERSVARSGGVHVNMRSFSMPNVEVGDIIEYQWVEYRDNTLVRYQRLDCQRDDPAWQIIYRVKPLAEMMNYGYYMRTQDFGCAFDPRTEDRYGMTVFTRMETHDTPAYRDEPSMPPELAVRKWALVFYERDKFTDPERFWQEYGKEVFELLKEEIREDKQVKEAAARITSGASSDAEKVQRLREFCLTQIRSLSGDRADVSAEERANAEENKKPSETLSRSMGTGRDINMLFVALAGAAGVEARPAVLSDRSETFFNINFLNPYFLNDLIAATRLDGKWEFHDLSNPYLETGMLRWRHEGVAALITNPKPKEVEWVRTAMAEPVRSKSPREGTFTLEADGTLVGEVTQTYTGHRGIGAKELYDGLSERERIDRVESLLTGRLPGAEVTNVQVQNADSREGLFGYSYSIRVPGYAAGTGQRLFIQPNYGMKNASPRFAVNDREQDIYFDYPWTQTDRYTMSLPDGFTLETPDAPEPFRASSVGSYDVNVKQQDGTKIIYERTFTWGEGGAVVFGRDAYPQLKAIFDNQHQNDQHVMTARRGQ